MENIIVTTTFANKKDAEKIAKMLIDKRLAACVQLSEIESYYKWNEKTENATECKVEIKTLNKNFKKIEELIIKNHKYEVPEIVSYKLNNGNKKYFQWMKSEII